MQSETPQAVESARKNANLSVHINPFEQKHFLQSRIDEGYFGPTASLDRSAVFEQKASPLVKNIKADMSHWADLYAKDEMGAHIERGKRLFELEEEWKDLPKGGMEEQRWTASAVAAVASSFEYYMRKKEVPFSFFDNQLYYMNLMVLDKGSYGFGNLSTDHRGVQLDTGEGKTICSGVLAGILSLKGQPVHIIEQNYLSTLEHAREMAPFLEQFFHIETGVVVDLSSKVEMHVKKYFDDKGLFHEELVSGDERKSYTCSGNKVHEASRDYAWRRKIVYADANSLSTDRTLDSRIGTKEQSWYASAERYDSACAGGR